MENAEELMGKSLRRYSLGRRRWRWEDESNAGS